MKRTLKFLITFIIIMGLLTFSFAAGIPGIGSGDELGGLKTPVQNILGMVQWFGFAIAIGMLIYIGIRYVTTSAEGKASMKSALIKYIIGAILIAAAPAIASWIYDLGATVK